MEAEEGGKGNNSLENSSHRGGSDQETGAGGRANSSRKATEKEDTN